MTLSFSKFKFTNGIFYKKIDHAKISISEDRFEISVFPYLAYCGKFYIYSIVNNESDRTIYRTALALNKEETTPGIFSGINEYFISISKNGDKAMIYDSDLKGIILKK